MFLIPGWLISLLTFPGVISHEIAHRLFADLAGVPVYDVCYFRVGNPAGYVIHGPVKRLKDSVLISVGPFIINTGLCALLTFPCVFPLYILEAEKNIGIFTFLGWIGISTGMHAFPSPDDMGNLLNEVKNTKQNETLRGTAIIFADIFRIANMLRLVWFDLIYASIVSMVLPVLFGFL